MKVKDIIDKSNCLFLISKDSKIVADNADVLGDMEKYYNNEVITINAFYSRQGIYKYGIVIDV